MKNKEELEKEEAILRVQVQELSQDKRKLFYSKAEKEIKDPDTYAVLNWLFIAGLHHLYLKKWLNACINIIVFLLGIILLFSDDGVFFGVGGGMLLSLFIIELFQLFKSQEIILEYNNQVSEKLLNELKEQK